MMVAMSIFSLVLVGVLACYFAGLQFNQFVLPKIQNVQSNRQTVSRLIEEVRCANSLQVGTGTLTNFNPAGVTNAQAGNALRIFPSTNTSQYIYYFHDAGSATLQRVPLLGTNSAAAAAAVTNHGIFALQDFAGNILTNSQNNAVMSVVLQVCRNSKTPGLTDAYQVCARVTRRGIL
jgi:hypothetical protein